MSDSLKDLFENLKGTKSFEEAQPLIESIKTQAALSVPSSQDSLEREQEMFTRLQETFNDFTAEVMANPRTHGISKKYSEKSAKIIESSIQGDKKRLDVEMQFIDLETDLTRHGEYLKRNANEALIAESLQRIECDINNLGL